MTHLLVVIAAAVAVIFYAWGVRHGIWTWQLFFLIAFFLALVSAHPKWPY